MLDLILGAHLLTMHADRNWSEERISDPCTPMACARSIETHRMNTATPGLYALDRGTGLGVGIVRNSFGRTSLHLDWTWQAMRYADLTLGAITHEGSRGHTMALVVPSLRIPIEKWALRASYLAGIKGTAAVTLSIERAFP